MAKGKPSEVSCSVKCLFAAIVVTFLPFILAADLTYPIVDTNQVSVFDGSVIGTGAEYPEQDGLVRGITPSYVDNGDGTISDQVTGLMWTKAAGDRVTYDDGVSGAATATTGGYADWRVPITKELYSLIDFSGTDPAIEAGDGDLKPFIDSSVLEFAYGESPFRNIDVQYVTSTIYVDTVMNNNEAFFGVNFADGRIKGYETRVMPERGAQFFAKYVRGGQGYGENKFSVSAGGEVVRDGATGLMWQRGDTTGKNWKEALEVCDGLDVEGHADWRVPNAKELHSIVDYARAPGVTASAAISSLFLASEITNEAGDKDFGTYWTSTTHKSSQPNKIGDAAVVIHFGKALGKMDGVNAIDVHGAGAQRSEPKAGNPTEFSAGRGPQGDVVRIYNMVRCVRDMAEDEILAAQEEYAAQSKEPYSSAPSSPSSLSRRSLLFLLLLPSLFVSSRL